MELQTREIAGNTLRDMVLSASNLLLNKKSQINDLNVFPVPDGDTGINMSLTLSAASADLRASNDRPVTEIADIIASDLLRGARGNSGVILSILFRGISLKLKGREVMDGRDFALAYQAGVEAAYKAVMKPSEGTILTVARVSAAAAEELSQTEPAFLPVLEEVCRVASETLDRTPEMLPVLKQAGVVDAGGMGLLVIFEGMLSFLRTGVIVAPEEQTAESAPQTQRAKFNEFASEDITFTYCTEFLINKDFRALGQDFEKLRSYLHRQGDCVVLVEDDEIVKIHVHTDHPGKVIEEALRYGYLTKLKIDNMREQHTSRLFEEQETQTAERRVAAPEKPYGFVSVAAGEGLVNVFRELGVDQVVQGGQTMNPSTEDILKAIDLTPAETVFVFPNNKNIIMAAEMAGPMTEKKVVVIPTKTIPQGILCMLTFDYEADAEKNEAALRDCLGGVRSAAITFAVRDSEIGGYRIKKGEILGLRETQLTCASKTIEKVAQELLGGMLTKDTSLVTLYYGADVTEKQANALLAQLQKKADRNVEFSLVPGGQPTYYYIISAE